ncbi:hypothetical protein CBS101457_001695 [Exobasidium rhododendri]|nr:hypothetical protein CBS101457_001695 [Exobasidium rhododendri]
MGAPIGRQLEYLIDRQSFQTDLRTSSLLSNVGQDSSTRSSEWHKFSLRIDSMLHANKDVAKGLQLALEMVREVPWESVVSYTSHWISSALMHFSLAIREATALLNDLLGRDAKTKLEYWRNVASINVPKYALALLQNVERGDDISSNSRVSDCIRRKLEKGAAEEDIYTGRLLAQSTLLEALCEQVRIHPTVYRSYASQLQKVCTRVFLERPDLMIDASRLLATLHLTGKGSASQKQLWTTTLDLLIEDVKLAWKACSSTFEMGEDGTSKAGFMGELPSDDMDALSEAHSRLRSLLGNPPSAGIIGMFLSEPTTQAVPVPLEKLVNMIMSILSVHSLSPPRQQPPPEIGLHAAQTALLSSAHISALTLLASLPLPVYYSKTNRVLSRVLRVTEKSSPAVRCVGIKVMQVLNLRLDPESQVQIHCARTCLAQVARLLKVSASSSTKPYKQEEEEAQKKAEKSNKRRRIYESDQVQFSQKRGFVDLEEDEYEACKAALAYLPTVYEGLATQLSPEHYDLAHTTALVFLGISEISLQQPDDLTATSFEAIAQIVRLSRGSILTLLTTKASSLASQGLVCSHRKAREGAKTLSQALEFVFNPRLPPKLSLKMHVGVEDTWQVDEQEVVLGKIELEEDRGAKEVEAMQDVLSIQVVEEKGSLSPKVTSPALQSPRRKSMMPSHLSPDPVKPSRRQSMPRIGSPSMTSTNAMPEASTLSPDRTPATAQLFGSTANANVGVPAATTTTATTTTTTILPSVPSIGTSDHPKGSLLEEDSSDDDDDDDDAIPEIDLRSSDEESDEKEDDEEEI